jgi:membrane fusion protein (multidrug efflux system)
MRLIWITFGLLAGLVVSGCKKRAPAGAGMGPGMAVQAVVVEAKRQPVSETLSLVGTLAPNEMIEVKAETDGMLDKILFREGQTVEQGDLLVKLDETLLAAAVAQAEANFKLTETTFARNKQLFEDKLISQQEFDQAAAQFKVNEAALELKRREWRYTHVHAPFSGVVGARQVSPGQVIARNTTLTWLVDLDPVKVEVNVPERYLGQVAIGQSIKFGVAAFPNEQFKGEVYFISPQLDSATRTALIKARIPNPEHKLKGGMFAGLALTLVLRDSAVVVPEPALVSNGDAVSVFVVDEKSMAQVRPVKIGLRLAGKAEVLSGVQPGDKVVVEGVQKLFPGAAVKPAPAEAAAPYLN